MKFFVSVISNIVLCFLRILPASASLMVGRCCGYLLYCIDQKHRNIAYQNMKIAFSQDYTLKEIRKLTRRYFINLGMNFVEFLRLPCYRPENFNDIVVFLGGHHVHDFLNKGKGAVLMTVHYGNWELPTLALALLGYEQSVIFKVQESASTFNQVMIDCRKKAYQCFGKVNIFERGIGARQLINGLGNNQMIGMLIDQGGKEGYPVKFFGRWARFSVGGMRLAIKTGASICVGAIYREKGVKHNLELYPFEMINVGNDDKENIAANMQRLASVMEKMIRKKPEQYMWMYKIWKYDSGCHVLILDDGRIGHLRQSEAVAKIIEEQVVDRGGEFSSIQVSVRYKSRMRKMCVLLSAIFSLFIPWIFRLKILEWALLEDAFNGMSQMKADIIVSAGSYAAPVNFLMAKEHAARSVNLLKPSILSLSKFDLVVVPQHDYQDIYRGRSKIVVTKGAPNLITDQYLCAQAEKLKRKYSHLKFCDRLTIGLLLGGDTKNYILDEAMAKILAHQVKDVAQQLNADILITTSRRTSEKVENLFMREFKKFDRCRLFVVANRNNIPEAVGGILGLSDVVVVTGDSISMVSEAASSGKKTVVVPVKRRQGQQEDHKHNRFVDLLNAENYILCSDVRMIKQAVFNLVRNKISTRKLDDVQVIRDGIETIL